MFIYRRVKIDSREAEMLQELKWRIVSYDFFSGYCLFEKERRTI